MTHLLRLAVDVLNTTITEFILSQKQTPIHTHIQSVILINFPMNYEEMKMTSSDELRDYLKQGFADVEEEDMIFYELYEVRGE